MKFAPKLLLSVLFAGAAMSASAVTYTSMVVFGDSLSDPGNAMLLTGGTPAGLASFGHIVDAQGHFSNGPTAAEYLADALSGQANSTTKGWGAIDPTKFSVNYAVGGALSGSGHIYDAYLPTLVGTGVASQISKYSPGAGLNASSTLFMVQGGANDFFQAFNVLPSLSTVDQSALIGMTINNVTNNMATNIFNLGMKGASNILWLDMPDLGLTPMAAAGGAAFQGLASNLSASFNSVLAAKIAAVDASLDAIRGYDVNVFGVSESAFLQAAAASPTSSMSNPCVFVPGALPNCNGLFFYDGVHPTTATHAAFAQQLITAAVPEPEMWLLMMVGVGIVGLRARRKA